MARQPFRQGKSDGTMEEAGAAGGASFIDGAELIDLPNCYLNCIFPYGGKFASAFSNPFTTYVQYYPFIAPTSGNVSTLGMRINTYAGDQDVLIGIYSDVNGTPTALLGRVEISIDSASIFNSTQFTSTITLVKGIQYWIAYLADDSTVSNTYWGTNGDEAPIVYTGQGSGGQSTRKNVRSNNSATSLPTTPSGISGYWTPIWPQVYMVVS